MGGDDTVAGGWDAYKTIDDTTFLNFGGGRGRLRVRARGEGESGKCRRAVQTCEEPVQRSPVSCESPGQRTVSTGCIFIVSSGGAKS